MELDAKLYKSFFILKLEHKAYNLFKGGNSTSVYEEAEKKIFITNKQIEDDKLEMKLLWETYKEIKSEKISETGEIVTDTKYINEVNKSFIWIYNDENPFIFVFTTKYIILRDIQNILFKYYGVQTYNVTFTNNFYNHLFISNKVYEVQSASYQTDGENFSSITISGQNIQEINMYDDFTKQENNFTEMTVVLKNYSRVKLYKNSKIIIYNTPSIYDVFETISDIKFLLLDGGYSFE